VDESQTGPLLGLLVFLIICSAFFSSSETGMLSLNRYRLRHLAREGHKGARRASRLLERPDRLLGTILVGNNVVNILAASIATVLAVDLWGEAGIAISTVALTIVVLIFGEITPKTLAALRPESIAFPASHLLLLLQRLLYPVVWLTGMVSNGLLRLFGIDPAQRGSDSLSTAELRSIVRESGSELPLNRQNMLLSVLDLETVTVNDIMIPRNEVYGIDLNDPLEHIIEQLRTTSHTRLPVFRGDINQIEGVVHMRQIARLLSQNQLTKDALLAASSQPYFVPESTPLSTQLINFQKQKRRIGIVVDEYGEVIGVATLEDILEEIVGEFTAQSPAQQSEIEPQDDGSFIIEGTINLRDLNRQLDWHLPCDGPKTLNGLVTEALESIPENSVCLQIGPYRLEILQVTESRVSRVRAWKISKSTAPQSSAQ
jgi:Mg2+/Co2+ transporter CorB